MRAPEHPVCAGLGIKPRASCMLDFASEPHSQPRHSPSEERAEAGKLAMATFPSLDLFKWSQLIALQKQGEDFYCLS